MIRKEPLPKISLQESKDHLPEIAPQSSKIKKFGRLAIASNMLADHTNETKKASQILRNINFYLNSNLHKKNKGKLEVQDISRKDKVPKQNIIIRNILDRRQRILKSSQKIHPMSTLKPTRTIKNGTLVLLENTQRCRSIINVKSPPLIKLKTNRKSEKELDKVRFEVVKWLLEYRKDVIHILDQKKNIFVDSVAYVVQINQEEFNMILVHIGIDKDDHTIQQRLFWVFDLDDNGILQSEEIAYGINIFKEFSLVERAQIFFNYCDELDNDYVTPEDLKVFLLGNVHSLDDKKLVKLHAADLFKEILSLLPASEQGIEALNYEQIYNAAIKDNNIRQIVEKNTRIHVSNSSSEYLTPSQFLLEQNHQSGLFYPELDNFYNALQEKSKIKEYNQNIKLQIINKKNDDDDDEQFN